MAKCQHPPDNRYPEACSRKAGTIAEGSPCNEIRKEMIDGLRFEMEALQDEWFVLLLPCDGRLGLVASLALDGSIPLLGSSLFGVCALLQRGSSASCHADRKSVV